ncbi:MAG: carboxypeptidase-like regulatory domain-containing protein [Gemmatimonadota bacterium]|nr:carboxypeptidase-like regulatory domain-containing protein [Gemmatimonadota bacterium]
MKSRNRSAVLVALTIGLATTGAAQSGTPRVEARLQGRIVDAGSTAPLPGAQLLLLRGTDTLARGRVDSLGRFNASGTQGERFTLEIRRLGYEPVVLEWTAGAQDTTVVIGMIALPQGLAEVNVVDRASPSSRLRGFEARARVKAGGSFLLRETIDAWHPIRTSDLMRRVMGVKLIDSSGVILAASTRGAKVDLKRAVLRDAPCIMRIGVDGQIKEWGFAMDMIDPNVIHGIEVYSGPATLPSEFSGLRTDSFCGLVMIWTRAGQ